MANAARPVVLWFRGDLRLRDQGAVAAAVATGQPVVPLYVLDDETPGRWRLGGASRWWLDGSLRSLAADLAGAGSQLVLRRGETVAALSGLVHETGATAVFAGVAVEPWARALSERLETAMRQSGVAVHWHRTVSLFDADAIRTQSNGPYSVYSPFARACFARQPPRPPSDAPARILAGPDCSSDDLNSWKLTPTSPDWAGGLRESWMPGEGGARVQLRRFVADALGQYDGTRNVPSVEGTSRLSPHLHFGEISAGEVWHAARGAAADTGKPLETFLKEVLWREFSMHLLWHHPRLPEEPLRREFGSMPFRQDRAALAAWRRGRTGIPMVDAGMRQLWQTGWMHNRVRLVVASFLVKHLLISWQEGESWFWDTLVDADLASNSANWQWIAGCGADAAPYFRVFNPALQGAKFDPSGDYVRRFVPELTRLGKQYIHTPWDAPETVLAEAGVRVGETYPRPIVGLEAGRNRALAAYRSLDRVGAG
ncbi:MAG: deoxyribodipyrimidine photo-lyase [Acetobacteraceae bacterium]|nr:deoxyribodipyrimidine photo-lyase [Acetobacteraceae bacterium]